MATMKPPPSSRRRVMLNLPVAIPLFEMQDRDDDETIRSFVFKTLNARASMPVLTITTDSLRAVSDKNYQELEVHFYSSSVESSQDSRTQDATNVKKTFFFVMPSHWNPRTFAASISMSLKKASFITVETVQINGCHYLTINDIDHYFSLSKRMYSKKLVDSSAYLDIHGGECYGDLYR
jgi:hypothetical protein